MVLEKRNADMSLISDSGEPVAGRHMPCILQPMRPANSTWAATSQGTM